MSAHHLTERLTRLEALHRVRNLRLRAATDRLAEPLSRLAELDRELDSINGEREQIERQRAAWERHWQEWLSHDGRLFRGQEHNTRHLQLKAWEEDLAERHDEVQERRDALLKEIRTLQAEVRRHRQAVEQVNELVRDHTRRRHANREHADGIQAEETSLANWHAAARIDSGQW